MCRETSLKLEPQTLGVVSLDLPSSHEDELKLELQTCTKFDQNSERAEDEITLEPQPC